MSRGRPFALLLALLVAAPAIAALEVPPPPNRWVTDSAGLLNDVAESGLNQKLASFEQQSGAQFIIYTFPSLEGEAVEDFTIRCVERWKVGQKKYDNGLVLFVFAAEHKVRVEVGYGLEGTITDAFSSRVIREHIAPRFQQNDFAGGLNAGADALMAQISKGEAPVEPLPRGTSAGQPSGDINPIFILLILFFVFFILVPMLSRGRRRGRGCNGCIFPFFFPMGGGGITYGGGGFSGGGFGGGGGGGFGGFSGGGGGFGGGGATGDW